QSQHRVRVGSQYIGRILRYVPTGADGVWPHEEVRDLIETAKDDDLEAGVEHRSSRGVTSRGMFDGGALEREAAAGFGHGAERLKSRWPRDSAMLRRVVQSYRHEARVRDVEAEKREDLLN